MKTAFFLVVAMTLGSGRLAAQTAAAAGDDQGLLLTASVAGGYDDDVTSRTGTAPPTTTDPGLGTGGSFVMTNLALNYARQSRKVTFGAGASSSVRFYRAIESFTADTHAASAGLSAAVAPRLRVAAHGSASLSSHYTLNILPVFVEDAVRHVEGPSLDYNLAAAELIRLHSGVQANYSLSRRSNLHGSYSVSESRTERADRNLPNLRTIAWGGGFSQGLTQHATFRLGFHRQQGTYGGSRGMPVDSYHVGLNYSRPLSISRRTTLNFSGGSAVVATETGRRAELIGHVILDHRISRVWNLNASYNRAVGFVDGFESPALTDSVLATLDGNVNRRVTVKGTLGYSEGNLGAAGTNSPRYTTYSAGARTTLLLYRGLAGFADYIYYQYHFRHVLVLPFGMPSQLNRQGVRVGLVFNVSLL
jgi:hypothetical protein